MKKEKDLSPKEWWICENEFCNNPLAKIIKGKIGFPEILEILGTGGQPFLVRPQYIRLYCIHCGKLNDVIAGEGLSEEWNKNWNQLRQDKEDSYENDDDDNFYTNPYFRNMLLSKLTPMQKRVFQYMQKNAHGEWTRDDIAKELQISEEDVNNAYKVIILSQADIKVEEINKELRLMKEEDIKFRKLLSEKKKGLDEKK